MGNKDAASFRSFSVEPARCLMSSMSSSKDSRPMVSPAASAAVQTQTATQNRLR